MNIHGTRQLLTFNVKDFVRYTGVTVLDAAFYGSTSSPPAGPRPALSDRNARGLCTHFGFRSRKAKQGNKGWQKRGRNRERAHGRSLLRSRENNSSALSRGRLADCYNSRDRTTIIFFTCISAIVCGIPPRPGPTAAGRRTASSRRETPCDR